MFEERTVPEQERSGSVKRSRKRGDVPNWSVRNFFPTASEGNPTAIRPALFDPDHSHFHSLIHPCFWGTSKLKLSLFYWFMNAKSSPVLAFPPSA